MTIQKEVERMRTEIHKSQEEPPSMLQPQILKFDNTGSSTIRCEIRSSTHAYVAAWGVTPREQAHTTQDPNKICRVENSLDLLDP